MTLLWRECLPPCCHTGQGFQGGFVNLFLLEGIGLREAKGHGQSWLEICICVWLWGGDYMETFHFGENI